MSSSVPSIIVVSWNRVTIKAAVVVSVTVINVTDGNTIVVIVSSWRRKDCSLKWRSGSCCWHQSETWVGRTWRLILCQPDTNFTLPDIRVTGRDKIRRREKRWRRRIFFIIICPVSDCFNSNDCRWLNCHSTCRDCDFTVIVTDDVTAAVSTVSMTWMLAPSITLTVRNTSFMTISQWVCLKTFL